MESEKYLEGEFMQTPPLFENYTFLEWRNKFENYVKSIDLDLWHVISIGDFQPTKTIFESQTKTDFETQNDYLKTKNNKNNEAKIIIYKTLPKVEYERISFCKTANDIWKNLLNFHQEKCQAKDEDFDIVHELVILENLIDKHLDKIDTCATSSNVVNEGINDEGYIDQLQS